jgi:hypothetical protein
MSVSFISTKSLWASLVRASAPPGALTQLLQVTGFTCLTNSERKLPAGAEAPVTAVIANSAFQLFVTWGDVRVACACVYVRCAKWRWWSDVRPQHLSLKSPNWFHLHLVLQVYTPRHCFTPVFYSFFSLTPLVILHHLICAVSFSVQRSLAGCIILRQSLIYDVNFILYLRPLYLRPGCFPEKVGINEKA